MTIISKDQTAVHHSNHHVALASMNNECVQNETSYETTSYIVFCLCATSLFLNCLSWTQFKGAARLRHTGPGRIWGNWTLADGCGRAGN